MALLELDRSRLVVRVSQAGYLGIGELCNSYLLDYYKRLRRITKYTGILVVSERSGISHIRDRYACIYGDFSPNHDEIPGSATSNERDPSFTARRTLHQLFHRFRAFMEGQGGGSEQRRNYTFM